jgi:multidrug efflux pump subunit AcrA (membrane-fusion protein)
MRPGLSVRVEVVRGRWSEAPVVPRAAVRYQDGGAFVRLAGASRPSRVRLATCTPIDCVVESGLKEGDRVHVF